MNEISKGNKRNIIWGFEEPENSYEAKNIKKLRDEFLNKYSRDKQIFITTHTKEFLSLKKEPTKFEKTIFEKEITKKLKSEEIEKLKQNQRSSDVSIYRVWKNSETNYSSYITKYNEKNNEWERLCDDLGIIQEARIIETLQEKLRLQSEAIKKSDLSIEKQKKAGEELRFEMENKIFELQEANKKLEEYQKPILIVEDKYDSIYKIAYLKLYNHACTIDNFEDVFTVKCPFTIRRGEGAGAVAGLLSMNNTDGYLDKKIIGLFDFDNEGVEKFYCIKKRNDWDDKIIGEPRTGLLKKRKNHDCFYAMLIPVPERLDNLISDVKKGKFESRIEIENLLPIEKLKEQNMVNEEKVFEVRYYKFKDKKKGKINDFLLTLSKENFQDFIPLFTKIIELFSPEKF